MRLGKYWDYKNINEYSKEKIQKLLVGNLMKISRIE
jgi:hypothetical protein